MALLPGCVRAGVGTDCQDRERQEVATRAYRDVLVASPGSQYRLRLPTDGTIVVEEPGGLADYSSGTVICPENLSPAC